jgi:hypothetical protein
MFKNIPSIPSFFRAFIMKGCWIFALFCIYWDHVIFVLAFLHMLHIIYRFVYVEQSLHPWNETNLVMGDLFDVLLNSVCQNFVEEFCVYVHWRYWFVILFFCCSLLGFE